MRKRIIDQEPQNVAPVDQGWLDLQSLAHVELTSEDAANPIAWVGGRHKPGNKRSVCCLTTCRG